ncbi:hypothetical protein DFP73DRAFT_599107 [Morchella snyderi]|nr:hypothetical protein DFP73DRAFT_599107 [Morchella snyderi]
MTGWSTKLYQPPAVGTAALIFVKSEADQDQSRRLDVSASRDEDNVMVEVLEMPRPKLPQLWTFEQVCIQSVVRPSRSAAARGNALPALHQDIAGVVNRPLAEAQRWMIECLWG